MSRSGERPPAVADVASFPGLGLWTAFFFGFLYFPVAILVIYSFNEGRFAMLWSSFGLRWYEKILENGDIARAARNSLVVAFSATGVATVMAVAAALALARGGRFRGQTSALGVITAPLVVPEIVTAVATLIFFSTIGLALGLGNLIIAHSVFCIPFAFMPIRARLAGMDTTLEQAARDLYATRVAAFRYVTLPLLVPGILAGATLAFVASMDDFIISLMVSSAGNTTLPVYIYSMIRQGATPEVNAISSILFLVSLCLVTTYWLASRPRTAPDH